MAKEISPQFQFYAQDFLTGCTYLTNEEIGMYIKMLCKQWTDGKIPKKRVGFLLGYEWVSISDELKSKFIDDGEFLMNERLELERVKKIAFRDKQIKNGQKGGRPLKAKNNPDHNPNIKPNESQKKPLDNDNDNSLNKYGKPEFLKDWNETKRNVIKEPSNLNRLSRDEIDLLNEVASDYSPDIIKNAMTALFKQQSFPNGNTVMRNSPRHFLNYINNYVGAYDSKNTNLYGKKIEQHD